MFTRLWPLGMVKLPPDATVVHPESVNQVTVPVELEPAVRSCPLPPAFTGLPKVSWNWTVITPATPAHAPAVKVREGVMKARRFPEAGVVFEEGEVAPGSAAEGAGWGEAPAGPAVGWVGDGATPVDART